MRRVHMILKCADEGLKVGKIAQALGCGDQTVREAIRVFRDEGLTCLELKKTGRKDDQRAFDDVGREQLGGVDPSLTTRLWA